MSHHGCTDILGTQRMGQKISESQEAYRNSQAESRQLQELVDMLKSEVQHREFSTALYYLHMPSRR